MLKLTGAILLAAALTACSSSSSPSPSPSSTTQSPSPAPTEAAPETALAASVRAYSTAYLSGDGAKAWGLLSQRCQGRVGRATFLDAVKQAGRTYGPSSIKRLHVDSLSGSLARVTYSYADATLDQDHEPWVREAGTWREDDC